MRPVHAFFCALPFVIAIGCEATNGTSVTTSTSAGGSGAGDFQFDGGLVGGGLPDGGIVCVPGTAFDDVDQDGFTRADGDCDDCDPNVGPNAVEVATPDGGVPKDENCNGSIDEPADTCDVGLVIDDLDPLSAAKAMDLCKLSSGAANDWGLVSAKWVMPDGAPPPVAEPAATFYHLGHGLLPRFGLVVKPRHGERVLALSSGTARQPTDPDFMPVDGFDKGYTVNSPEGFPKESPACPDKLSGEPHDAAGLELTIHTPSNAKAFSFDFDFFTYEWSHFICSTYNDFFIALLSPIPAGQADGNISFDSLGNPVSVNNAFLEVCGCLNNPPDDCMAGGKAFPCSLGDTQLLGTGFGFDGNAGHEDHGSTDWLVTTAPVVPNSEITIRLSVYDSGDGALDTTTLIDNWRWIAEAGIPVRTMPVAK
ncbi:Cell division protein FtsH [Minicystis rosea]|nr:Cell division protein FtsH [Minicystis rosea]